MTDNTARQPKGIPVGGQFAATAHAEPALNLTPRRAELDGWPEALPEPEVDVTVGDDNAVTTTVSIEGVPVLEVWHEDDDVNDTDATVFESEWLEDEPLAEAAEQWARGKHSEIARELRTEMHAAVERSRARVLAKATGVKAAATDDELSALIENTSTATSKANRDLELASTALASRYILEEHPEAVTAHIQTASWDNGVFVDGATVKDEAGTELASYSDEESTGGGVAELLVNLSSEASNSNWADAFSVGSYGDELYTIDLRKAASWAPGDDA
ncbi:hypothetical protein Achl_4000 (plasmid) [Pseudarthrobacter chlorophenolicus A6]|uniref:Uncharacterized protein n=1 Tax=Pseudarthrobacter chlorophenolicus (strain ATCC 700700 / DSM 12829 / CIP 107037 / JCM 12360 / KCTC 9906 / NCIMB 13794 / A6) TaxID=452863 RepID=B8HHQ4_PSECP|nr:hypothetical protein [Pseudarthrobacter chlorophenolicus]ACL41951.1 hypothetical protein Achl_4000 [Pseudarthrobacter chlorophenolicus A6]SDQ19347.1 hypothetical protein SAMN04489738_0651 [Pseudarthrobacter chlorophenolicus]